MVPKTLKVGDKFTDGNRIFEVLSVVEKGVYISKLLEVKTEDTTFKATVIEKKPEEKKYTKTEVNRLPNEKLEELCKELGLEVSTGTVMKKEIIEKLGL